MSHSTSLARLNAEWLDLAARTDVTDWVQDCTALQGARDLDDVLSAIRDDPDAVLHFLLLRHREGDSTAGRVVLQTMLPKVLTMARHSPIPFDDLLSSLWIRIDTYPIDQRPRRIAANLSMDMYRFARDLMAPSEEVAVGWVTPASARESTPSAEAVLDRALEGGLISPRVHTILTTVYCDGLPSHEAGRRLGMSSESVRYHCSRTIRHTLIPSRLELAA